MGVLHENEEWTEVMGILTPLLSMRDWGSLERERSLQGHCAQQICGRSCNLTSLRLTKHRKQSSISATLPLERDYRFYQPISFFCNLNFVLTETFIKMIAELVF
jgi:hypothetical protein